METHVLPRGTLIYRSYNDASNRDGFWFSLDKTDTFGYGLRTAEFRLSRDLVLADITSPMFYEHLKTWLINVTSRVNDLKRDHPYILFPLGFNDTVFYKDFAKLIGFDVESYDLNPVVHTESMLYFGNRSRVSVRQCDVKMMEFLKIVIGSACDGICSLNKFPDIIRNGMHHPELSVFDNAHLEFIQDVPRAIIGGAVKTEESYRMLSAVDLDNEIIRNYVERMDNNLVKLKTLDLKFDIKIIKHTIDNVNLNADCTFYKRRFRKTRKQRQ